jgi:YjbE family integral membrane protein
MDLHIMGSIGLDADFLWRLLSIVLIDLILAGDNAVIIAMAVRSLPREQRKKGIFFGAGAAVLLRVVLTFFVSQILQVRYLKLIGGALILWIAVKLFVESARDVENLEKEANTIGQAIKTIVIADITMSLDNMLAVGGVSAGSLFLLLFGLGLSIPFIIFTSSLLSSLMDRYPVIICVGAAILGKVGAEMMLTDPVVMDMLPLGKITQFAIEGFFAVGVIVAGKLWMKWLVRREQAQETAATERVREQDNPSR